MSVPTTDRAAIAEQMIAEGRTRQEIADRFGIPLSALRSWASRAKVKLPPQPAAKVRRNPAEERRRTETVQRLIAEGKSRTQIAETLGIATQTLGEWCRRRRITLPGTRDHWVKDEDQGPSWGEVRAKAWLLRKAGATHKQIATTLGIHPFRVADALSRPAPRRLATVTDITQRRAAA